MTKNKRDILGVEVDDISLVEAIERAENILENDRQYYFVTPNPEMILLAQHDNEFKKILSAADLAIPDGAGLLWAARILKNGILRERVTGTDLIRVMAERPAIKFRKIFALTRRDGLLCDKNGFIKKNLADRLKIFFPNLIISAENSTERLAGAINDFGPSILLLTWGAPQQEKWIAAHLTGLPSVKLAIGVGGALDFLSGRLKRAPVIFQRYGLEWLWRFFCQPWRFKRIFAAAVVFPWIILRRKFFNFFE